MRGTPVAVLLGIGLCAAFATGHSGCGTTRCGSDADCAEGLVCYAPSELCVDPGAALGGNGAGGTASLPTGGTAPGGSSPWPPSCSDGERDGDETDVDCGGSCLQCIQGQQCGDKFDCDGLLACFSGYCCESRCGSCMVCDLLGHEGTCAPAPIGQDPGDDCRGAISCNGVDGCCSAVDCSAGGHVNLDASALSYGIAITVEAWVNWLGPTGAAAQRLLSHGEQASVVAWQLALVDDSRLAFSVETGAGSCLVEAAGVTPTRDEWQHVAAVYAAGELRLYLAGALIAEATCPPGAILSPGGGAILVGHPSDGRANALVDEVRISATSRYDADFVPAMRLVSDAETIGLWHFDDGDGRTAIDSSGNGRDGSLEVTMWSAQSVCDLLP